MLGIAGYAIFSAFTFQNALGGYAPFLLWMLIVMPIVFILTTIIGMKHYSRINGIVYLLACLWLPMLVYFFISAIVLTVITAVLPHIGSDTYRLLVQILIAASVLLVVYGTVNAQLFKIIRVRIPATNRLANALSRKKIFLVSDTHIGLINGKRFLKRVVSFLNRQNPDIVLFAGDLIDGPRIPLAKYLEPLKNINAVDGVFYAPGNHEVYSGKEKELYAITDTAIHTLAGRKINLQGVDIVGLPFDAKESPKATLSKLYRSGFDPQNPSIVINHVPNNNPHIQDAGADLVVSGHTHGGQFWPFTHIVKRIFKDYTHGLTIKENTASITTVGIGTWGPPVRIGTRPEIIEIIFE